MTYQVIDVAPALYCGTYAKYNDGRLGGKWLNLRDYPDAEAFLEACRKLHSDECDPEFMFQDYEGFPRSLYGESMSLADLRRLYGSVCLDDDDRLLYMEYLEATGSDAGDTAIDDVRDKLCCILDRSTGSDDNTAMGRSVIDEGWIDVPDCLQSYIDVAALGRDWLMDLCVSPGGYVFQA